MKVSCDFCEHRCSLSEGAFGVCGIRQNRNGKIVTVNYGELVSLAVDPVEKKPFFHIVPNSPVLSLALFGCNFHCPFCQNYTISQKEYRERMPIQHVAPAEIPVKMEKANCSLVAYTYSEPTVWQDYMLDCAKLVKERGGRNLMVTNGFFTEEAFGRMKGLIDGFNIDLKGGAEFYKKYAGGVYEPVLRNIAAIASVEEMVVEVTTLLIEGIHTESEILSLGRDLASAGVKVWHLSRFFPCFKMADRRETSEEWLEKVMDLVREKIDIPFVYSGNSRNLDSQQTICPSCGEDVVSRAFYGNSKSYLKEGCCPSCGERIYGIF